MDSQSSRQKTARRRATSSVIRALPSASVTSPNATAFAQRHGLHALRIELVLVGKKARSERLVGVRGQHRHDRLADDGAAVEDGRHEVHGRAVHAAARVDRALMRVETGKEWQKRRVDVENLSFVAAYEPLREDSHEARENDHGGLIGVDRRGKRLFEGFARGIGLVVERHGVDPFAAGRVEPLGKRTVGNHRRDLEAVAAFPVFAAGRAQNGFKIAAAAGNQDNDVLHDDFGREMRGEGVLGRSRNWRGRYSKRLRGRALPQPRSSSCRRSVFDPLRLSGLP